MNHAPGELVLGGRLAQARRPRAHTLDGREVVLPSWVEFRREDPLTERAVEQMVLGVANRKYERSLEPVAPLGCAHEARARARQPAVRRSHKVHRRRVAEIRP
jgi:hypothetical protein